jgi:predicted NAD-dependent protein-ADP-ribosyltransferase YbiA (DUF1768 family)
MQSHPSVIFFNSKTKSLGELSNFHSAPDIPSVESEYKQTMFPQKEVRDLFKAFEASDSKKFLWFLKQLQPGKNWTDIKEQYWFRGNRPIHGILSKLAGAAVLTTAVGKKRKKILAGLANVKQIKIEKNTTDDEKKMLMLGILRQKFSHQEYADVLLGTGNAVLHEKPMRGKPNNWSYRDGEGGDWLGQLLMQVRDELRNKSDSLDAEIKATLPASITAGVLETVTQ